MRDVDDFVNHVATQYGIPVENIAVLAHSVGAVLDLTAEFPEADAFLRIPYLNLPVLDLTAPTLGQLAAGVGKAAAAIRRHRAAIVFSGRHRRLLEDYRLSLA